MLLREVAETLSLGGVWETGAFSCEEGSFVTDLFSVI
jgi:hypothetical protein